MSETAQHCMVLTTCDTEKEAQTLAAELVEKQLAACVQLSTIRSFYTWEGKACQDPEILLAIKTRGNLYGELEAFLLEKHSYDEPEIVQLPISAGSAGYLGWIDEVTK